ncbi:hypothetical protein [Vibrio vulnificus YJ016]|uniref:Uncharacterized protein n=1 Tax=Vibrio vulnificus (strain YJ016) TaxID=196600 RepID=Q7MLL6_VIBVY|nr:hypothetical protein [Vibrio vulnificus YJ016]
MARFSRQNVMSFSVLNASVMAARLQMSNKEGNRKENEWQYGLPQCVNGSHAAI